MIVTDTSGPPKRILVVDDDPTMLLICRRFFRKALPHSTIVEAKSGEEAIEILRSHEFDLVLSDYRMGAASGTDVLAFALERHPGTTRVLMSGFGDPSMIQGARARAQIHEFVEKPMTTPEIEAAIMRHVVERHLLAVGQGRTP